MKELRSLTDNADEAVILLTAPTGVAAYNIGGSTIHSALSISPEYGNQQLGYERLDMMRSRLDKLAILVIDEISLVTLRLLTQVHDRLQTLRGVVDRSVFWWSQCYCRR